MLLYFQLPFSLDRILHTSHHFRATYYSHETLTVKILHAMNATDEIIRSTARHIDAIDGRYDAMANKSIHAYMISVNGTEEQFFLRYVGHSQTKKHKYMYDVLRCEVDVI